MNEMLGYANADGIIQVSVLSCSLETNESRVPVLTHRIDLL